MDLGCGSGRHSIYFNKLGFEVYALDLDCSRIRENISKLNLNDINIYEHAFTKLPYPKEFFDIVICTSTIHHAVFSDITKGFNEVFKVLKQGGYFLFDILSKEDSSYGLGEEIESNTFIGSREGEETVPHHYSDENEIKLLIDKFSKATVLKSIYSFKASDGIEYESKVFDVAAIK